MIFKILTKINIKRKIENPPACQSQTTQGGYLNPNHSGRIFEPVWIVRGVNISNFIVRGGKSDFREKEKRNETLQGDLGSLMSREDGTSRRPQHGPWASFTRKGKKKEQRRGDEKPINKH